MTSARQRCCRVFYTSMGHREDVWSNPKYQRFFNGAF